MPKGRPLAPLSIAEGERKQLTSWSRRRTTAQALALRARIFCLAAAGLSNPAVAEQVSIHRIWRAFALAPHRSEPFKLSRDPLFIDKVRDIVGLYLDPPDRA